MYFLFYTFLQGFVIKFSKENFLGFSLAEVAVILLA